MGSLALASNKELPPLDAEGYRSVTVPPDGGAFFAAPHGTVELHFDLDTPLEVLEEGWELARRQMIRELAERGTP